MIIGHTTCTIYKEYISLHFHRRNKYPAGTPLRKFLPFIGHSTELGLMKLRTHPVIYNYSYNTDKQKKEEHFYQNLYYQTNTKTGIFSKTKNFLSVHR